MALNGMPVGAAPTGKSFEVSHIHWQTLQGGQIVEHYANRDDLGMLRQLGLLSLVAAQ
jgi:predicted ester cyclase